jgi:hypothetical protein
MNILRFLISALWLRCPFVVRLSVVLIAASCHSIAYSDQLGSSVKSASNGAASQTQRSNDAELSAAKGSLVQAIKACHDYLKSSEDALSLRYLAELRQLQMVTEMSIAATEFDRCYEKLIAGTPNLENKAFVQLRAALIRYTNRLRARENQHVVALAVNHETILKNYLKQPADPAAVLEQDQQLRTSYEWLSKHAQAPFLLEQIKKQKSYPNLNLSLDSQLIRDAAKRPFQKTIPIRENQQGVFVSGTATLHGKMSALLQPSPTAGNILLRMHGAGDASLTIDSHHGRIWATSTGGVEAHQPVRLDGKGLALTTPRVKVSNVTTPQCAQYNGRTRIGTNIMSRIMLRTAHSEQESFDRQAQPELEQQIRTVVEQETHKMVASAEATVLEKYLLPLRRRGLETQAAFSTSESSLSTNDYIAYEYQLGALTPTPTIHSQSAISTQFHESLFNNMQHLLQNVEVNELDFRELLFETFGLVTKDEPPAGREPYTMTFSDSSPIALQFKDQKIKIRMTIREFIANGKKYNGREWIVKTEYSIKITGSELEFIRGDLVLDAAPEEKSLLTTVMESYLIPVATTRGITLTGELFQSLKIQMSKININDGWLIAQFSQDRNTSN